MTVGVDWQCSERFEALYSRGGRPTRGRAVRAPERRATVVSCGARRDSNNIAVDAGVRLVNKRPAYCQGGPCGSMRTEVTFDSTPIRRAIATTLALCSMVACKSHGMITAT